MIIRYPESLKETLRADGLLRSKDEKKYYRGILEDVDEEYVLSKLSRKKVDGDYYSKILDEIDNEYVEELIKS